MARIVKLAVALILAIACLSACKSSKINTSSAYTAGEVSVAAPDYFTSRLRLQLPQALGDRIINGSVKMQRDEIIQISLLVPVLRTEAARIEVTPTDMLIIDRMNKEYVQAPSSQLQHLFDIPMDYQALQDTLAAAVFANRANSWVMKTGEVVISIPVSANRNEPPMLMELSRLSANKQPINRTNPPSRYKEVTIEKITGGMLENL